MRNPDRYETRVDMRTRVQLLMVRGLSVRNDLLYSEEFSNDILLYQYGSIKNEWNMFLEQKKPKDYDCGYNLDLMIDALPRVEDPGERIEYAKRVVGLIKQSHPNWVDDKGRSHLAWNYFFELAEYDPRDFGIENPYESGKIDDAQ